MFDNLNVAEIFRYMGHTQPAEDEKIVDNLQRLTKKLATVANPKQIYRRFPLEKNADGVLLVGTALVLRGKDIRRLLEEAQACYLMAATLGVGVDQLIAYTQKVSLADSVMLDAIASTAIESVCDQLQETLNETHATTQRYSCGYGDLPLEIQPQLLSVLDTQKKIGLYCNEHYIMIPRKSVTAIMGIVKQPTQWMDACDSCLLREKCTLRKEGKPCGRKNVFKK